MVNVGIDYGDACRVFKTVFLRWHVCFYNNTWCT